MLGVFSFSNLLTYLPIAAQANSFSRVAREVTSTADPMNACLKASKLIIDVCAPPNVKYPLKCSILLAQITVAICSGKVTSVTSTSLAIGAAKQVLEEFKS